MPDTRTKQSITERLREIEERFGSKTICTAKWLQATTLLYNGTTHSCHHNPRHKIDYYDVQKDYTLIHNTPEKIKERELMKKGKRPPGCNYCWKFEDNGSMSDRYYKSANTLWSYQYIDRLETNNPIPTYFEVAFDYTCNLKCMYCSPESSSKWMEEIRRFGAYSTSDSFNSIEKMERSDLIPIAQKDYNPYVEAFWKWWPELSKGLKEFRITGGEPLLSKNTWKVLDSLIDEPKDHLIFGVNTNLSVESKLIDKFIGKLQILEDKVSRMEVYTSCEAAGRQAEYIRFGLNYKEFLENCEKVLSQTKKTYLTFMTTINALSIFSLETFIKEVQLLQIKYPDRVYFDLAVLTYPKFLSIQVVDLKLSKPLLERFYGHILQTGSAVDIERSKRLLEALNAPLQHIEVLKRDFAIYFTQYDQRRNVSFRDLFPELTYLLDEYESTKDTPPVVRRIKHV